MPPHEAESTVRGSFVPESIVHPATGPTTRVVEGVRRDQSVTPELFPERAVSATRSFQETEGEPIAIRRAKMIRRILEEHPVTIQAGEVVVGMKTRKPRGSPVFPEINCAWVERDIDRLATRTSTPFFVSDETKRILRQEVFPYWRGRQVYDRLMEAVPAYMWRADDRGIVYHYFRSRTIGHITAGYRKVLTKGMNGIKADVARVLSRLRHEDPAYIHRRQFLESVTIVCDAVVTFAARHADEVRRLAAAESDPARRTELLEMAAVCERVPAEPARTFHEALQSFWFTHLVLNLETDGHAFGPGRFDQYLYPYYRHSVDSGEISQAQAQELIDLMWVKFDEITVAKDSGESQTSSSYPEFQNLNIGGLTRDGRDATNELTFMCLTALDHTKLPQPGLSAQISSKTTHKYLVRCAELLRQGMGMPAMFNSDAMVLGMVNRGKTLEDARGSSLNGCVAVFCDGKDRMASTGYFNLAKCLELALNDGVDRLTDEQLGPHTGRPATFASFEAVIEAFHRQVAHFVDEKIYYDNIMRDIYATYCPVPFTSAVIDDCIEQALDWHAGGSHYKIGTMSGVAVGTVADALAAIKKHVFEERTFTMAQLQEALDRNWDGFELMRQVFLNKTPHYGNDDDYTDDLAVLAQKIFCDEVERHHDIQ
ncbi:MAG: pyruvate formate lyase family protein, partial [Acidobacteria bacterium]|nr:pyruvate formate lyase family protein [Acidobacteriota bacterium]